jgi:cobalt-zinc-cadmium efflux system outer membrane protein
LRSEASRLLFNNPELNVELSRRRIPGEGQTTERTVGIAQTLETGGQQGHRRKAADANFDGLRAEIEDARAQVRADAALRFEAVLTAKRRLQIEERAQALFESTASAVEQRRQAGEDTRLDANVAAIEAERARNALSLAREQLQDARAELATVMQLPPADLPDVAGELQAPAETRPPVVYDLQQLLRSMQELPKLRLLAAREDLARARLDVERASRSPDITLGLATGREGAAAARERVTTFSVTLPLPIFRRNAAAIGQAMTDLTTAEIERAAAVRDSEAQVRRLWLRLGSQQERVARLQRAMLPVYTSNQQLIARSRQAGQIGVLDQILANRQALDAEREWVDALTELQTTRIELERAAGWPQEGTSP